MNFDEFCHSISIYFNDFVDISWLVKSGSVSKPCTPGEHQNSWDLWMFIPLKIVFL